MAQKKNREDSIGKTFESTLLKIEPFDKTALDKDYDFFLVENKGEEDHTPVISDPKDEFTDGRICGTCAEYRKRYVMLRKNPDNYREFMTYLDKKGDDFTCEVTYAAKMKEKILLNLLLNASSHELIDWLKYNNLSGEMIMTYSKWCTKNHITTVKASVEKQSLGFVLKLSAKMFSRIGSYSNDEDKKEAYEKPMYVLSKEDYHMHRTYKVSANNYVEGNSGTDNAKVLYSNPKTSDSMKLSKNYIFDRVIENVNTAFENYIHIEKESLTIEDYLDPDEMDVGTFMSKLTSKIKDAEYTLINAIPDFEDSQKLQKIVIDILRDKFGKEVQFADEPVKDRFNLRIIHDDRYYKKYKLDDEYKKFPGYVVQHLTVEKCITESEEDAIDSIMNVLIKELFIKECVQNGEDLVGKWKDRGFKEDVVFLKREIVRKKPRLFRVFRLTMHPNGTFDIDYLDDNDPFLSDTMKWIWYDNRSVSETDHVIIYKDSVCTIENSGIVPVLDNKVLMESISILEEERKKIVGTDKKRPRVPDGLGPRGYQTYNKTLYAITDIQRLSYGDDLLYMCGYDGSAPIAKYEKAPNIRLVKCIKGENFFHEILDLMNVPFVRFGQTTVYPYPYKFLNEYIEEYKRK